MYCLKNRIWQHGYYICDNTFNNTFISLIPKKGRATNLEDYRPISLFNVVYNIIAKIISNRVKGILSNMINDEQFAFLVKRQIHDPISISQEILHSVKTRKIPAVIIKVYLSKEYNHINWARIRLILVQIGFEMSMVNWILSTIQSVSFSILFNGFATNLFRPGWGLCQGFPIAP